MTSGIIDILVGDAGVQAIVGLNKLGDKYKVFPFVCPQGEAAPFIVVSKQSNNALTSLDKTTASLLDYPTYYVISYSKNFRTTELMHEACRAALDNQGFIDAAGYDFNRIWLVDDKDSFDKEADLYAHISIYGAELKRVEPT